MRGTRPGRRRHPHRTAGVTLIEVLVVVALVSILALLAVPSYQAQVNRTWRITAVGCLEELAQGMERRYTTRMSYAGTEPPPNGCVVNGDPNWVVPDERLAGRWRFAFAVPPTRDAFTLVATPSARQASPGPDCGSLSVDQSGRRAVSGRARMTDCW